MSSLWEKWQAKIWQHGEEMTKPKDTRKYETREVYPLSRLDRAIEPKPLDLPDNLPGCQEETRPYPPDCGCGASYVGPAHFGRGFPADQLQDTSKNYPNRNETSPIRVESTLERQIRLDRSAQGLIYDEEKGATRSAYADIEYFYRYKGSRKDAIRRLINRLIEDLTDCADRGY